jgi:putative ABC transport system substrate-binding protein
VPFSSPFTLVVLLLFFSAAQGGESSAVVAVIYPQTEKPYRRVFDTILAGIESRVGSAKLRRFFDSEQTSPDTVLNGTHSKTTTVALKRYPLAEGEDPKALKDWLQQQRPATVITLGRSALNVFENTELNLPHVIGALDASPQTHRGPDISLQVDPELLFGMLKRLVPRVRRVCMVYNPARHLWIYNLATEAATRHDLQLHAFEVTDIKAAAKTFWRMIQEAQSETDALWLPMDNTILDSSVVSVIIEQSWYRNIVVFSNNLLHAKMGALFAVFPENHALGIALAEKALQAAEGRRPQKIEPLRTIKTAVNLRVSEHLGIAIDPAMRREIDLFFGQR